MDLHIHTTYSDGIYTPEEIVKQALAANISCISITDHNVVTGVVSANDYIKCNSLPLELIPGVEIDTFYGKYNVHILGYGIDCRNSELLKQLQWMSDGRIVRIKKMITLIQQLGYALTWDEVLVEAAASKSIGRPHIARCLINKGYFESIEDVFKQLIGEGKPGYVKQDKLTIGEAIELIHNAGGKAVMAHPAELEDKIIATRIVEEFEFDGIEVWNPSARGDEKFWAELAGSNKLIATGGSDYHGDAGRWPTALGVYKIEHKEFITNN